ncbi:hypothetical protein pb186bvf_020971 [Paramecium bursaria]
MKGLNHKEVIIFDQFKFSFIIKGSVQCTNLNDIQAYLNTQQFQTQYQCFIIQYTQTAYIII